MQEDIKHNAVRSWLFGYIPAGACVILVAITVLNFSAILIAHEPKVILAEWSCYGKIGSDLDWERSLEKLLKAQAINPWDADIDFNLGRLYEWRALSGKTWKKEVKESRKLSIQYYQNAIQSRPTWALAWVNLAQSKVLLNGQVNDELFVSLRNALKYGRWESATQQKLLWLSIGIWDKLSKQLRKDLSNHIVLLLKHDEEANNIESLRMLTSIAVRFDWLEKLEQLIENEKHLQYVIKVRKSPQIKKQMLTGSGSTEKYMCQVGV